jgi:2-dehydropantoate 2-reductase
LTRGAVDIVTKEFGAMRICVYGAGATGGHFAVALACAGHDVSVIARGPHLAAIQQNGITLVAGENRRIARVTASDNPATLGPQDLVMVMVKATGLSSIARQISPLIGAETMVLFPQNGMSWWYPLGLPPERPVPPPLPIFALGASFQAVLAAGQILGGSIYSSNEVIAPGIVRNGSVRHNGLTFGPIAHTPASDTAEKAATIRAAFEAAGIVSPLVADIRTTLWTKLLVNMSGSSIALATGNQSSISRIDPDLGEIYLRVVREGLAVARAHGYALDAEVAPDRLRDALLDHRPSLLQDYEAGRPMEVAEIIGAPVAFARAQDVPTPTLDVLAAITSRLARDRGLLQP